MISGESYSDRGKISGSMERYKQNEISVGLYSDNNLAFLGGGEVIIISLGNFLSSAGINVTILDDSNSKDTKRINEDTLDKMLIARYAHTPYENPRKLKFLYHSMPSTEALTSRDLNLIFVHRIPSVEYLEKVSRIQTKVTLCLHGIGLQDKWPLNPIIRMYQRYVRFVLRRISSIVNTSDNIFFHVLTASAASILVMAGIRIDKVLVIPNGIDPKQYKIGRNDSKFTVLFMGRMDDLQKGIKRFRKVTEIIGKMAPEIEIISIGSGPNAPILDRVDNQNFHYLGYVDDKMKSDLLLSSNLLLLTSNMEPFSLVCLEGLFSGLPIVTTPTAGPSEIVSSIHDAGKISGFNSVKLALDILEYYRQWRQTPENYYIRKVDRSNTARKQFNIDFINDNYRKFITSLYLTGYAKPASSDESVSPK